MLKHKGLIKFYLNVSQRFVYFAGEGVEAQEAASGQPAKALAEQAADMTKEELQADVTQALDAKSEKNKEKVKESMLTTIRNTLEKYQKMTPAEFKKKFKTSIELNNTVFDELMEAAKKLPNQSEIGLVIVEFKGIEINNNPGVGMVGSDWPERIFEAKTG